MGDAQSAQREGEKDAAFEDESSKVDDAQAEHNIEDKSLKNKEQISEINAKADSSTEEVNGHCEDETAAAEAVLSPDEDVSQTETPLNEETPLENVEINEKESANEADANEELTLEMTEMDAKQNDINESFRRFFGNIGLKLTVKRGSGEIPTDVPNDTNEEEPNKPEDVEDTTKETTSENAEQNSDVNIAPETYDNDSTTCPTLTDITTEDVLENAEEKATETKVEVESHNADAAMTSPLGEDANQDTTTEEEPRSTSPSSPEEEVVLSPIKRFFTTGIFSGLRKKKKLAEHETTDKEMKDIGKKEVVEKTEQTVQDQQQDKEDISLGVEAAAVETEYEENKLKGEILSAAQMMDTYPDPSTIIVTEPEVLSSQEKDKVQASPLKRLLSGSSLKKLSKKQRGRKSSDAKLSDSGEYVSDQLLSSTETVENQKEEGCAQPPTETVGEEDGAWASFKKLLTPKKRMKKSSLSNEETQIPGSGEEAKPSEGGKISDQSTEEGKKRKDSSVSWDSVLCRSGRRRSRKTSDSEDETPQIDNDLNKQDGGSKHGAEPALENEVDDILAHSPKQAGSPSDGDGASTWKSLKRLVTPKRKSKDDDESKDNVQSDSEVTQDESSFSIKKLLPGRKKRKSAEKQDQVSSDEADKEAASGDEDSDTPAVVPLSEFDTVETEVHIQTQADVESNLPKEADFKLQQALLDPMAEPVLPCDNLQTEAKNVQGNDDALENQATTTPATNEKSDDLTESISKQQLSDIPEEATPASVTEEAARDDTIAEDLIEITSEAITAAEHLDLTLADETEMISAVSQLSSESSKTSGNTTPVPADYVFQETDVLLHNVVETISISPETVPVCSHELRSERKVVSVSHQILEAFVKPTIMELHSSLDTTRIHTGLKVEELDANNELAPTTQIASIFEVNDSVSTEILSEVPTEEFDTAEITEDEVQEVDVTHPEDSVIELESIDESHYLVECLSEVNAAGSKLPEGDEIVPDKGSLIEAHQTETEPPKLDSQEADLAATVADETKDGAMEQEVPSLTNKEDQVMHNIIDQIQAVDDDQQPVAVEDLQELADVQALTLCSEKSIPSLEYDIISEGIPAGETVTYELKEVTLTEVSVEPEKEDELETDAAKPEHVQVPEPSEAEQASTLYSEEVSIQSPKEEVKSEDILPAETVTDEPKQSAEVLTEVSVEPENKELPVNIMKTVQEPEVSEAVQLPTLYSEEGSVHSLEKEVISEIVPERETDESKEETIPLIEENLEPVDASKTEHVQELEASEAVQAPRLDSKEGSVQSPKEEVKSEDIPTVETVTDDPKQPAEGLTEVRVEPENKELPANVIKTVQEPEVFEAVQAPTIDSEEGSVHSLEKEVISDNVPEEETMIGEPKQTAECLTEVSVESENKDLPMNVKATVQEPEVSEAVQAPTLDSEEGSVHSLEKEVISEIVPEGQTDKPKEETIPLTEENLEPVDASKTEHVQELEASEAVQAPRLDSKEGSVQSPKEEVKSEDIPTVETVTDEPKQSAEGLTEVSVEPENKELPANVIKTVQEPEVFEAVQAPTLDSEEGRVQSFEKEVISDNVPQEETVIGEPKQSAEGLTEVSVEPENKELPANVMKTVQEPEVSEAVQAPTLDSEEGSAQSFEKEVISDNVLEGKTLIHEPTQTAECLTEVSVESENKELPMNVMTTVQEPEVSEAVQAPTLDSEESSAQSFEKEVISENVPEGKTYEPKEETIPLTEENLEPVDASKSEHVQEPEVFEAVQAPILDSEESSAQSFEKEVISDNVPEGETYEPKQETIPLTGANLELVDASKTDHVQEPEVSEAVQAPTLYSEEGSVQSLEKEAISEIVPEREKDEPKEETIPLTEENLEPVDASKTEHVQELEASEAVQAPRLDLEEGSVQSPKEEVKSEDIPTVETVTDKPKQSAEGLTEVSVEPENKELPANVLKTVQEPEVVEAVQAPTLDSEEGRVQSFEKELISENVPEGETYEPKEETIPLTEENLEPVDASKTEHVQEPEVFEAVQAPTLDSEESSAQSLEKEVISDNVPEGQTDKPKEGTIPLTEENLEPVDASKTEHVQELKASEAVQAPRLDSKEGSVQSPKEEVKSEDISIVETVTDEPKQSAEGLTEVSVEPENKELQENVIKTAQQPEVSEAVQAPTLDSEEGSVQSLEKEVISEIVPERETDKPKEETIPLSEENLEPVDDSKTGHVQELEASEAVQAPRLDSKEGSVQSPKEEVKSEDISIVETVTDEPKQSAEGLTEVSVEPENKELQENVIKTAQQPEVSEAVQAPTLDSEEGSVQSLEKEVISEIVPERETDKPKEETIPLSEENLEPVDDSKTGHVQEPEVLEAVQAPTLDSEEGSVQSFEKEAISDNVPEGETDKSKEETIPLTEENLEPVDASKTEHVQELEASEAVQAPKLDSKEGSVQSPKEEVKSEDISIVETVTDEPKQSAEGLTEVSVEPENKELPANVLKTVQEPEVFEAVQASTLDSGEGSVQLLEKEVISENVPEGETYEPKEETLPLTEENLEPVDASKTEHVQEPEVFDAVQAPTLDSEEGSVQSLEKEVISDNVISQNVPEVKTVSDKPKQTSEHLHEVSVVQESEVIQDVQAATLDSKTEILLSLEKKEISEDIPVVETVIEESKQENEAEPEEKPVEAAKTEHAQEPEGLPSDVKDHVTETNTDEGTSMCMHVVTESIEGSSAQEFEKQILLDEVAKPNIDRVIASVTDGLKGEGVAQLGPSLERAEVPKKESITQDVGVEQEHCIPEVVDELLGLTEVCVSSVNEEASNVQVLEKTVLTKDTPAPCEDNAAVTNESKHEVHLSAVQVGVEGEKESEFSDTEIKTAAVEHAVVAQVVMCAIKDVSAAIPDVLIEKESPITEPLIERVTSELVFKEDVQTATPLVKDDKAETAEEVSVVGMMHVPLVEFEDNNRTGQVVNDDIKSAETIVDTVLEVGITEVKGVIDVCHENGKKVDDPSATPEIEEELMNEQNKVLLQNVIQHVKENLPETVPESLVVNLGQEGIEQPDTVTKVSEMVESESNEVEDQKGMADGNASILERQDETSTVISDVAGTGKQVTEDLMHTRKANEPASPPPITERSEPVKKTDGSEVGVQAVEVVEPVKTIKQTELTEVAVQAIGTTELAANLDSKERTVITAQPVLLDISIQAMEPEEQIKARVRVTSSVQATETMQPVRQTEKTEVSPNQPVLSEAYDQQTKAEEPAKQKEEDPDVWMDAEEDVYTREETEARLLEVEKSLEPQTESEQEGKARLEHEVEMAPNSKKEEESQKMHKAVERCETDSEGEEFAVAFEHPETETASVTTMERN